LIERLTAVMHSWIKGMRATASPFFCLFGLLAAWPAWADAAPADAWIAQARAGHWAQERMWRVLLHFRGDEPQSLIDDPLFFLAPQGFHDPEAELEATLAGMATGGEPDEATVCRFPARSLWLRDKLGLPPEALPQVSCPTLDKGLANMEPRAATLVYPVGDMNSPGTMFGHTLLRIDGGFESPLLSYAISYAAQFDPDANSLAYIYKGIFGGYPGRYSVQPYFEKVKEYSNLDQRDIWEYRLTLSPEQVRRMVLHAFEIHRTTSDYYFLDENCSYNLLFLVEAARPDLHLTDRYNLWVTPGDTVADIRAAGLIQEVRYRPSQSSRLWFQAGQMSPEQVEWAADLAHGEATVEQLDEGGMEVAAQTTVLDAASELLRLDYGKHRLTQAAYLPRFLALLRARSALGSPSGDPEMPFPPRPDLGHPPSRMVAMVGGQGGDGFVEWRYRPAYHELLDPAPGYGDGSEIQFLPISVRYYPALKRARLQQLDLFRIDSPAPRSPFFSPISWRVRLGWSASDPLDPLAPVMARLAPGLGGTWRLGGQTLGYVMAQAELAASQHWGKGYRLGGGGVVGAVWHEGGWGMRGEVGTIAYGPGRAVWERRASLAASWSVDPDWALRGEGEVVERDGRQVATWMLGWAGYF